MSVLKAKERERERERKGNVRISTERRVDYPFHNFRSMQPDRHWIVPPWSRVRPPRINEDLLSCTSYLTFWSPSFLINKMENTTMQGCWENQSWYNLKGKESRPEKQGTWQLVCAEWTVTEFHLIHREHLEGDRGGWLSGEHDPWD